MIKGWVLTALAAIFVVCYLRRKAAAAPAVHGVVTEPTDEEITVTVVPAGAQPKPTGIDAGAIPGDPVYQ